MGLEDYKNKDSVVVVYTGDGKGKTSASIGLLARALGAGMRVAFIQYIKTWQVSEHKFIKSIEPLYKDKLLFHKGGKGFYKLGELSARNVSPKEHKAAAFETYRFTLKAAGSGDYDLVICDEINTAYWQKLLTQKHLRDLITKKHSQTSLCLTGRGYPNTLIKHADIATEMTKLKHHFDQKFLANRGIDY